MKFDFLNTKSDSSLFVYVVASTTAYFLAYVDDLIIIAMTLILLQASYKTWEEILSQRLGTLTFLS